MGESISQKIGIQIWDKAWNPLKWSLGCQKYTSSQHCLIEVVRYENDEVNALKAQCFIYQF